MGRQYTIEHYRERLAAVRAAVPGIAISTDVIVGFCGETEAQFEATLEAPPSGRLRPGLRGGVLVAAGHARRRTRRRRAAAREAAPAERAPRPPGGDRPGTQPAPGSGGRSRSSWTPSCRRAATTTTTTTHRLSRGSPARLAADGVHLAGRSRENKLVHLTGPATLLGSLVTVRDRPRRALRAPGSPRLSRRRAGSAKRSEPRSAPPLLVIAGATATGKTGLALAVADALIAEGRPVEIISADSRQVFRGLDIGTAKVGAADRGAHPAPRPRPRRAGRAVQRRRLHGARGAASWRRSPGAAASRSSSAGPGCICAPSPAGSTRPPCRATSPRGRASRRELEADGVERRRRAPDRARPDASPRSTDLRNPRRVARALEIAELRGDGPLPPPLGYPGPVGLGRPDRRPGGPRPAHRDPGAAPSSTRASSTRRRRSATGSTPASRRSRRSAMPRPGRSWTASSAVRPRSLATPPGTSRSRSASGHGSGPSRGSPGSMRRTASRWPPRSRSRAAWLELRQPARSRRVYTPPSLYSRSSSSVVVRTS